MGLLLDLVKEQVTSAAIDKISDFLGEGRGNTSNAITAAIPTLLGFLSKKTETAEGASSLIKMATNSDLVSMFAGNSFDKVFEGNRSGLMAAGNSMLIDLFGNKEADLSSEISKYANIGKESSDGILASILPLVMSVLGSKITSGGLNASSLSSLFEGEKESIFGAIPAGLASLAGLLGLGKIGDAVSGIANAGVNTVSNAGAKVAGAAEAGVDAVSDGVKNVTGSTKKVVSDTTSYVSGGDNNNGGGMMKWLLPLLGILAAGALLWFLMKGCDKDKETADTHTEEVVVDNPTNFATYILNEGQEVVDANGNALLDAEGNAITIGDKYSVNADGFVIDANGEFVYDKDGKAIKIVDATANVVERTLGDVDLNGAKLQAYPGGIEEQLIKFINSDDYKNASAEDLKKVWFNFDDLNFEFGTTTLTPESKRQVDNIVAILKAYPDVKIKLGAYTDKKGSDEANLALSQKRADAVKAVLDNAGVGAQIAGAEGFGEKFATVAEDASDKEREADRKTAVRLAK